ncbi:MAG: hypothetical protein EOO61_05940 [Hymenobacter sp.]|nr:MAG: hypothetical protein EOO61_05940 [Hymenobacter sp.]
MIVIDQEFSALANEFSRAGANLTLNDAHSKMRVRTDSAAVWFTFPDPVEANNGRVPGWFLAGIWDVMQLRSLNEMPDSALLIGWGFVPKEGYWVKNISTGGTQQLLYGLSSNILSIKNLSADSTTVVGQFPRKSLFHAQKMFEENGWFGSGESMVKSLDISDYYEI